VPISLGTQDNFKLNPSGGVFKVKLGYEKLQGYLSLQDWPLQKSVWKTESLHEINFFMWTMLKGNILTTDNLKRKGIHGPSICPLCCNNEETIQHLFVSCKITKCCWLALIRPIEVNINFNLSLSKLYDNWKENYPYSFKNKNLIKIFLRCLLHFYVGKYGLPEISKSVKAKSQKSGKF